MTDKKETSAVAAAPKKKLRFRLPRTTLITLAICLSIFAAGKLFPLVRVVGDSMHPTFKNGNILMTSRSVKEINRDDMAVFTLDAPRAKEGMALNDKGRTHLMVKRVVGVPGDMLQTKNGYLYVNQARVFFAENRQIEYAGHLSEPLHLLENEYFIIGDNPNSSYDSRHYGPIHKEDIEGMVEYRLFGFLLNN